MAEDLGRAKRRRTEGSGSVEAQPEICHGGAGSPVGQKRERIKAVHQVISKFCDKKKALVSATGFGGLLRFPPIGPMHRKFVVWLMSRVDPRARTLVVDGSRSMKFDKEDVSRVFGIPCEGKKVTQSSRHVIGEVMDGYLGKVMKDHRSIKAAQEVLEREHDGMMTVDEEKAFKAAFVIYVVSTLLAPGSKYDQTSFDYWDALVDPDAIGMYDWSDYVLCRLIDGVSKVKADLWGKGKVVKITGCTLFLQVLYLDSIDTGKMNMDHYSFPRVHHFAESIMRSMILTDTVTKGAFGNSKFRPVGEVCYSWARQPQRHVDSLLSCTHSAMWDTATSSYCNQLSVPYEAVGPFFFALMDIYNHLKYGPTHAFLINVSVVVYIASLFGQGFRYYVGGKNVAPCIFRACCHECISSGDAASSLCVCGRGGVTVVRFPLREAENSSWILLGGTVSRFVEESPTELVKHCMTARAMSRFYMSLRCLKDEGAIDLNKHLVKFDDDIFTLGRKLYGSNAKVMTPWSLGLRVGEFMDHGASDMRISRILSGDCHVDIKCIAHYIPKYIDVTLSSIKYSFEGCCEMEMDLFDAAVRRFQEIDNMFYERMCVRWRHFFESDFMASILAGTFDRNDHSIRAQLLGSHLQYDISTCRMLLFPGLVEHRWIVSAIKGVMGEVVCKLMPSWDHDWKGATMSLARMSCEFEKCTNFTGLLCSQFCFSFDGNVDHASKFIDPSREAFASLIYEISKLSSNHGFIEEAIG